ncbi:hypothetical protein PSHT_11577 [Puccinia striiformis]|nr:hypothetical protein PSHT_11577 [Puccinia striiformis]POW13542.1 hypothetical protein PSTT_03690 [Puccinia striiformis]
MDSVYTGRGNIDITRAIDTKGMLPVGIFPKRAHGYT